MRCRVMFVVVCLPVLGAMGASGSRVTIDARRPGAQISPTMYGVFFEDINYGADGGLYAELLMNRSFEFPKPLQGWRVMKRRGSDAAVTILRDEHRPRNPRYVRIAIAKAGQGVALINSGFQSVGGPDDVPYALGVPVREGAQYRFSVEARQVGGQAIEGLRVALVTRDGARLAQGTVKGFKAGWGTYECMLTASATEARARLQVWVEGTGTVDLDMVSLFPKDTWRGRKNGLRGDLVQMLADMKPGFLRFPGGCIVEGFDLSQRYQWKDSIGDPNERVQNINRWNFEFRHRPAPDYFQTYGLGYYEFFLLAEDLGAEPMPIVTCGMACQFNTAELVPMDQLGPYVQDMLDLIEFANGPVDSTWGRVRAEMGHPEPFNMKMLGIGNEQWGPQYIERYRVFARAIKARYPEMQLIGATGSDATIFPNGVAEVDYLWSQWRKIKPEFVDEHFYRKPEWFAENTDWYDDYDRNGPKLFVGEYASQSVGVARPDNRNLWKCALYEAAFMTGMERNAEVVHMTCYAPLFGHEEAWQWRPDLIWFDNLNVYGSANYYVQQLFSLHPGTHLLDVQVEGVPNLNSKTKALNVSVTWDKASGEVIIKAVNVSPDTQTATVTLQGVTQAGPSAQVILLTSDKLTDENSLADPKKISPRTSAMQVNGPTFSVGFKPYSMTIIRVPAK